MCATISDSFKQMNNISKALNMIDMKSAASALRASSLAYYNISELKVSAAKILQVPHMDEFKAIANNTYINSVYPPRAAIQGAAMAAVSIPNLNALTSARNSLSRSIASTLSPTDLNFSPKMSAQIFGDALTTMRYFSTSNNHINLQWKNLMDTELNDEFMSSFMDISNAVKLSKSLGISENELKFMQNAINTIDETHNEYETGESNGNIPEESSANNHMKYEQKHSYELKDNNKKSQNISPVFFMWLFVFLIPTALYVDGTIRKNDLEVYISNGISLTISAYQNAKDEMNKQK